MTALEVMHQNNGDVTTEFYAAMNARGPLGELAVALFRAQKRSIRAKEYRRGRWRRAAYDVKSWSISEVTRILSVHDIAYTWGWKPDHGVLFAGQPSWVLYVELPQGQVSFHSPCRGDGPDYPGEWDGRKNQSVVRIIRFCDAIASELSVEVRG